MPCCGQFAGVWPPWEHPREGRAQAWQVYSGIVERVRVSDEKYADYSYPAPAWYRSQRSNLIAAKDAVKYLLRPGNILRLRWMDPAIANYGTYLTNGTYTSGGSIGAGTAYVDLSNVIFRLSLPTNYFDYTPWRGLDGIGPFTNDATVGRPHGWTNATTAGGGSNYPAGRGTWYTTDYGWGPMTGVVGMLSVAQLAVEASATTTGRVVSTESYEDWADVVTQVNTDWPTTDDEIAAGFVGAYWVSIWNGSSDYATVRTGDRMLSIDSYTSVVCGVEIYANITLPVTNDTGSGRSWTFDANGSGFVQGCQKVYDANHQENAIPYRVNPNYATLPNSAGEPGDNEKLYRGWQWDRQWAVARFNFVWK